MGKMKEIWEDLRAKEEEEGKEPFETEKDLTCCLLMPSLQSQEEGGEEEEEGEKNG